MSYTLTDLQQAFQAGIEEVFRIKKASLDIHQIRRALMNNPASRFLSTSATGAREYLRQIRQNWDNPNQLAATYGQNFASPQEQKQLFEAANQGKRYQRFQSDKDFREHLLGSFDTVHKSRLGDNFLYSLQSPLFTSETGGNLHYAKATFGYPTEGTYATKLINLHPDLRKKGYASALEAQGLQNLASHGFYSSTSDDSAMTSGKRQATYEKNIELYPGLITPNLNFKQMKPEFGPAYTVEDNRKLGQNLERDSKKLKLSDSPVNADPERHDSILFIPQSVSRYGQNRKFHLSNKSRMDGAEWGIHRYFPEGFSKGSLDPTMTEFTADPKFIEKHRNQFVNSSDFNAAMSKALDQRR